MTRRFAGLVGALVTGALMGSCGSSSTNEGGASGGAGGNAAGAAGSAAGGSGGSLAGAGGLGGLSGSDAGGQGGAANVDGGDASSDAATFKRVFATSKTFGGDLQSEGAGTSGLNGADKLCNEHAANLGGTWVAWLSTGSGAIGRITSNGPWYRVDGSVELFPDRDALKGVPKAPIAMDENGFTIGSDVRAWTGTDVGGTPATTGQKCNAWTSGGIYFGQYGEVSSQGTQWTDAGEDSCLTAKNRLICFEL